MKTTMNNNINNNNKIVAKQLGKENSSRFSGFFRFSNFLLEHATSISMKKIFTFAKLICSAAKN